jgi:aminopeptidase-like protein
VTPEQLDGAFRAGPAILGVLEHNTRFVSCNPMCEPQLGRRGLYAAMGGADKRNREMALLWVMNLSDGAHTLLDIAERSGLPFDMVREAAARLTETSLLRVANAESPVSMENPRGHR